MKRLFGLLGVVGAFNLMMIGGLGLKRLFVVKHTDQQASGSRGA